MASGAHHGALHEKRRVELALAAKYRFSELRFPYEAEFSRSCNADALQHLSLTQRPALTNAAARSAMRFAAVAPLPMHGRRRGGGLAPGVGGASVDLDRCQVTDDDVGALASGFAQAAASGGAPAVLSLQGNPGITDGAAAALSAIVELGQLRELWLGHTKLTASGVSRVAAALPAGTASKPLDVLDLTFVGVGDDGACALADAVRRGASVTALRLYRCHVGDEGVVSLADAAGAQSGSPLAELDLGCNAFGSPGVVALGSALATGRVRTLGLRNNDLRPEDVTDLCAGFASTALESLDLRKNKLGDRGAAALAAVLLEHPCLSSLDVRGNKVTAAGARELILALRDNDAMIELELGDDVGPDAAYLDVILEKNLRLSRQRLAIAGLQGRGGGGGGTGTDAAAAAVAALVGCKQAEAGGGGAATAATADADVSGRAEWPFRLAVAGAAFAAVTYVLVQRPGCPAQHW